MNVIKIFLRAVIAAIVITAFFYLTIKSAPEKCDGLYAVDGDTLCVFCPALSEKKIYVRLVGIDAPENGQPYWDVSRDNLNNLCQYQKVFLRPEGFDKYQRTLAQVECRNENVAEQQVKNGLAWVDTRYQLNRALSALQKQAKQEKSGLWRENAPLPPWEYRKKKSKP